MRISDWSSDGCSSDLDFGHQYAAARFIVDRVAKAGERDQRQAENLDPRALVADLVLDPVVHHLDRANLPARVFRTAFVVLDRAGGIGGVFQLDRKSTRLNSSH